MLFSQQSPVKKEALNLNLKTNNLVRVSAVVIAILMVQGRAMAIDGCLIARGSKTGAFKGSSRRPVCTGNSDIAGVIISESKPIDKQTMLSTGRAQYGELVVDMLPDSSLPLYYTAFTSNETLTTVTLNFFRASQGPVGAPADKPYLTIMLTNAQIFSLDFASGNMPVAGTNVPPTAKPDNLRVSFGYQKIEWIYTEGGITATQDVAVH